MGSTTLNNLIQNNDSPINESIKEDRRSFQEVVDQGVRNKASNLRIRNGDWRNNISAEGLSLVENEIKALAQDLKSTKFNFVLMLNGEISQTGINRLINIIWDTRKSGVLGSPENESALKNLAIRIERIGSLISENSPKDIPKETKNFVATQRERDKKIGLNSEPSEETLTRLQKIMDKHAKGNLQFGIRDIVGICNEEGVDWKLAFLMFWKESHWGTNGRAKRTFNPGNVGNTDSGASKYFGDKNDSIRDRFLDGIRSWCRFMKDGYATTLEGFIETKGKRIRGGSIGASYASRSYTNTLKSTGKELGLI